MFQRDINWWLCNQKYSQPATICLSKVWDVSWNTVSPYSHWSARMSG